MAMIDEMVASDADREGVLALNEMLLVAWNAHDAEGFVKPWEDDADHVNIFGDIMLGKDEIRAGTIAIFGGMMSQSRSDVTVRDLRFPTRDIAILDLDQTLTGISGPPGNPIPFIRDGRMESRIKIVAKRRAHGWTVASFQNTAILRKPPLSPP
jgi:uncharacterized protein (TIGR02246 family)